MCNVNHYGHVPVHVFMHIDFAVCQTVCLRAKLFRVMLNIACKAVEEHVVLLHQILDVCLMICITPNFAIAL